MKALSKNTLITGALLACSTAISAPATETEISELKRRIEALEARQTHSPTSSFAWSGALELEAVYLNDYDHNSSSDFAVATALLAVQKKLQPDLLAGISFLYEEPDTSLDVDEAFLSFGIDDTTAVTGGQIYLPFGQYQTSVISDPLTLELGEIRDTAAMVTYERDGFSFSGYVFRGDSSANSDSIETLGGRFMQTFSYKDGEGFTSVDFISNLLDSDSLSDLAIDFEDKAEAIAASAYWENAVWGVTGEYLTALFDIDSETPGIVDDKKPAALHLECFYNDSIKSHNVTFAASYQQTKDALLIGLPKRRWAVSAAVPLTSNLAVSAQLFSDRDYSQKDNVAGISGTGDTAKGILVQLAAEI